MPRGTYCKTLAKRRRAALQAIMDLQPFDVENEFVGKGILRDGEKAREMLQTSLAIYKCPEGMLRGMSWYMTEETRALKLAKWVESVIYKGNEETSEETKEIVEEFKGWFESAREAMKMELAAGALAEGETPKGKAKFRVLERRFAKEWSESCVVNEAANADTPKVSLEERFGGFLQ